MKSALETKLDVSLIALILANLAPIYGILFDDWTVFQIFLLFWLETAVIGFYNILKIKRTTEGKGAIIFAPFFILHFGIFMFVHLMFIITMFGFGFNTPLHIPTMILDSGKVLTFPIVLFLLSHGISYYFNFIRKEEYKHSTPEQVMMSPYGRVVVMHITIIFGGIVAFALDASEGALVFLVMGKIIMDIIAHNREHAQLFIQNPILDTQK